MRRRWIRTQSDANSTDTQNADVLMMMLPIVIVIRDELGAISQALLTIEAAKRNNLIISCVVLNEIQDNSLCNKDALMAYTEIPIVSFSKKNLERFSFEIEGLI